MRILKFDPRMDSISEWHMSRPRAKQGQARSEDKSVMAR